MSSIDHAALALQHFVFAGQLALVFSLVSIAYLFAVWRLAGQRGNRGSMLILHTLFLAWQSNVAYLAVVTLHAGRTVLDQSAHGVMAGAWAAAPWLVPGAAVLYSAMLLLCVAFSVSCARSKGGYGT